MILEYKNYVPDNLIDEICQQVVPFVNQNVKETAYNRDGFTVNITDLAASNEVLKKLDEKLSIIFAKLSSEIVSKRFKPQFSSGDSGYEYHLYRPGNICHYHSDGEVMNGLVRYATVILFLSDNDDGELIFPSQNIEIKPQKGKIVVFPPYGFFGHYSKPSVKNREILMTWFVYSGVEVKINAT
jgi:endo-1,4-beta-mannosidase